MFMDEDSWGLPYRQFMGKLRPSEPGLTVSLASDTLEALLDSLFLCEETHEPDRE